MSLPGVDAVWKELGVILKLDLVVLDMISKKYSNQTCCKRDMFHAALQNGLTWTNMLDALIKLNQRGAVSQIYQLLEIYYGDAPNGSSTVSSEVCLWKVLVGRSE